MGKGNHQQNKIKLTSTEIKLVGKKHENEETRYKNNNHTNEDGNIIKPDKEL